MLGLGGDFHPTDATLISEWNFTSALSCHELHAPSSYELGEGYYDNMFQGSNGSYQCQHGTTECEGNKVHACAAKYVTNQHTLSDYTACMIRDNYDYLGVAEKVSLYIKIVAHIFT